MRSHSLCRKVLWSKQCLRKIIKAIKHQFAKKKKSICLKRPEGGGIAKKRQQLTAQLVKNLPAVWETWVWSPAGKIPWRREQQPTPVLLPGEFRGQRSGTGCSPWDHRVGHNCVTDLQCKRPRFDPWFGRIPWRRAWQPTPVLLPGEPPRTEEPDGLQSMGSQSRTWLRSWAQPSPKVRQ